MSVDAITLTHIADGENVSGKTRENEWNVTLSSGYPTGGYTISPQRFGFKILRAMIYQADASTTPGASTGYLFGYIPASGGSADGKLIIYDNSTGAQVALNANLATVKPTFLCRGI